MLTQHVLLQGEQGFSRKGPDIAQASYYYSWPHLAVSGAVTLGGSSRTVSGAAWLDHEWSSEMLATDAIGWDWTGINLHDGSALMAFRIRQRSGAELWAGGTLRTPDAKTRVFATDEVRFVERRRWSSPRTGVTYPIAMALNAAGVSYELQPLMDDQELDARASTGTVYWEGAVRALAEGREVGRGYLELTGYGEPLKLQGQ